MDAGGFHNGGRRFQRLKSSAQQVQLLRPLGSEPVEAPDKGSAAMVPSSSQLRFFAARTCAAATASMAALALTGWVVGVPILRSVVPGAVEMKVNAALGLLVAALAVWQVARSRTSHSSLGRLAVGGLAGLVLLLGVLTLAQYIWGWNLRIDEAILADSGAAFNAAKGRMSPYTAAAFCCIGAALMALVGPGRPGVALVAAVVPAGIGVVSLIGYGWNAAEITSDAILPPVAINTAIALMLLAAGIALAALHDGSRLHRIGTSPADRLTSMEKKVLVGFGGSVVLLLVGGGLAYKESTAFADAAQSLANAHQVRAALGQLRADIEETHGTSSASDGRTGTGNFALRLQVAAVRELVSDNRAQVANLAKLEGAIRRMGEAGGGPSVMPTAVPEALSILGRMQSIELGLLQDRSTATQTFKRHMLESQLATIAVALTIFALMVRYIRRQMRARHAADAELVRANARSEAARREAEAANNAKSRFLAAMSHEIRTPMNGVLGLIELVSLGRLDAEQRSTLGVIAQSGRSLLRIVDDILDFSKIEAGKLELHAEPCRIPDVLDRVSRVHSGPASSKGLVLRVHVNPRLSDAHVVDELRLEQVLNNFASNAIKFTEDGHVELAVDLVRASGAGEELRFRVTDSGIGIAPEKLARLFQPFTQAEADTSSRYGGTGLGLTICRRLAQLMGGTADLVPNAVGGGMTAMLTVWLPVADPATIARPGAGDAADADGRLAARPTSPAHDVAEKEGTLVLAVDDHPTNRLLLKRQLNLLGYAVETAADGKVALELIRARRFGAVVTDCNMPEMSGYELARQIRLLESAEGRGRIPILACTANAMHTEAALCAEAGMDECIVKPARLDVLARHLDHWLPLRSIARPVVQAPRASLLDESVLREMSGGDLQAESEVLRALVRVHRQDHEGLRRSIFDDPALEQIVHFSHRLRGGSAMVGAHALAAACEAVEVAARAGDIEAASAGYADLRRELLAFEAHVKERHGDAADTLHTIENI